MPLSRPTEARHVCVRTAQPASNSVCSACERGKYSESEGQGQCIPCIHRLSSLLGASNCSVCASGFYLLSTSADPRALLAAPDSHCLPCDAVPGVDCGWNTRLATLNLTRQYWRHSDGTNQTWRCKSAGGFSPCLGGADAGDEGDGYCAPGYRGLRCELCVNTDDAPKYFDKLDVRCRDCGDVSARTVAIFCALVLLLLVGFGGRTAMCQVEGAACEALRRCSRRAGLIWQTAPHPPSDCAIHIQPVDQCFHSFFLQTPRLSWEVILANGLENQLSVLQVSRTGLRSVTGSFSLNAGNTRV